MLSSRFTHETGPAYISLIFWLDLKLTFLHKSENHMNLEILKYSKLSYFQQSCTAESAVCHKYVFAATFI